MKYISTRDSENQVSAAEAIAQGISGEGGLFVPAVFPKYDREKLDSFINMTYNERAKIILADFLTDFLEAEIAVCVDNAYNAKSFPPEVTPIVKVGEGAYSLELWHGPTYAFKDMALQLLPHLLTHSIKKVAEGKTVVILVATSGDTGKAALEGFKDVEDTVVIVFYPDGGVSPVQYLQMATQEGNNVRVCGVVGNFDDTQTAVKEIFAEEELKKDLADKNMQFSSANSINWGRLLPQIVYYFSSYADLCKKGEIVSGEKVNFAVPTGNFGNILAAYYAKKMGLPIHKLICASNTNNVLTDFINTGEYDRRREFVLTSSPSMDILISSNLERFLFEIYGDSDDVSLLMEALKNQGVYKISAQALALLKESFYGNYSTEEETAERIRKVYKEKNYLMDTHTAVAFDVYEKYKVATGDSTKTIIVSTANPYKFSGSMLDALEPNVEHENSYEEIFRLKEITGAEIPKNIENLDKKEKRFTKVCSRGEMLGEVKGVLKL